MKKKSLPSVMITSRKTETASDVVHDLAAGAEASGSSLPNAAAPHSEMTVGEASFPFASDILPSEVSQNGPVHTEIAGQRYPGPIGGNPAVLLRARAERIVRHHAAMAGCGGIIPVPIVNISAITTMIVRMLRKLAKLYDVSFDPVRTRALVISLLGGTLPTGFAVTTSSTLVYLLPGANLAGMAVSCISAIACTRAIGHIFIEYFERESVTGGSPAGGA